MRTDDTLYDPVDRNQRWRTHRRREERTRRRAIYGLLTGGLLAMLAIGMPSLISHSSFGRSLVARVIAAYGLEAEIESLRVGWLTPLRIEGLTVQGDAGSRMSVERLDIDLTAGDLIASSLNDLGHVTVRGVDVVGNVADGRSSIEDDLVLLLASNGSSAYRTATVKLQDLQISLTDAVNGSAWRVAQSSADIDLTADRIQASFAGVLTEPGGSGGSLQGTAEYLPRRSPDQQAKQWRLELNAESLPLSVVSLLRRRFPDSGQSIPASVHGDASGAILLLGTTAGAVEASVTQLNIRNFTAAEAGSRVWSNRLATLDGELILVDDRIIGRQLRATSDFAAADINGAFSRNFSLVGVNDNPLRWLEAIDGQATIEADLAAFDQSLPGMLPLREEAELISGRIVAQVDTTINGSVRRSNLVIHSDAIRARSGGHAVVIDPVELVATVSSDRDGPLQAEKFEWKSAFGSGVGNGDIRSGHADVQVDFGRLTSMLRPIMHISESSLDGIVRGKIDWNASDNNTWKLSGDGSATNLVISMPNGQTLRRSSMRGTIEAVGRWGGDALQELTSADVSLATNGLDLRGQLIQPVARPSSEIAMPLRIEGNGRMDSLLAMLRPWLPTALHDAAGSFQVTAQADVSGQVARLTTAKIDLTEPKLAYGDRYFSQPQVAIDFDGLFTWPAGDILARRMTVAGDAFSMAAIGNASAEQTDMKIKWRAKLERIQGSVRHTFATRTKSPLQAVAFRRDERLQAAEIGENQWLVTGDCEGEFKLRSTEAMLQIITHLDGQDLAIIQPRAATDRYQPMGPRLPMGRSSAGNARYEVSHPSGAKVVWSEPNLKVDGSLRYDVETGQLVTDGLQIAGDWFATNLSGDAQWNDASHEIQLTGPMRIKMDQVADRLSALAGIRIAAEGIQETPLELRISQHGSDSIDFRAKTSLGWERSEVAGVVLGESSIPIVLSSTSVTIAPTTIAVGNQPGAPGRLSFAGQIHFRPGPLWMRLEPGSRAESIRLTPEMTDRWLKYLAPLAADTARIDGTMGVHLNEALIVFDQPDQSRVIGRLDIVGAEMTSGPLTNQIYGGIQQLKNLANSVSGGFQDANPDFTLITMPPQTVDFYVSGGIVQHNRMFFTVDRAEVITSGRVAIDGRLDLIAQVPLDQRWLGSDLKGMANQPVTLPIDGTLSRPSLDSEGVRRVATQLGTRAIQESAENYLQKQIGKGMEKLFGR